MASPTRQRPAQDVSARAHHAKAPLTPIAGPYGHPFHPILVTVPIGAWVSSVVFDIASLANADGAPTLVDASFWLIGIGIVGAAVAAVFGLMDFLAIPRHTRARTSGLAHLGLNLVVVALYVVNWFWRLGDHATATEVEVGQLVLSIVALALLGVSGWIGGMLTYRFGVRVVDETEQAAGYR